MMSPSDWMVWAQAIDPITGGAGWAGAGLLSLVLGWLLLRHLPEKDRQAKELMDAHIIHMNLHRKEFTDSLTALSLRFSDELAHEREVRDRQWSALMDFFEKRAHASALRKGVIQ